MTKKASAPPFEHTAPLPYTLWRYISAVKKDSLLDNPNSSLGHYAIFIVIYDPISGKSRIGKQSSTIQ